jgi:protein-S-isoprenylcysteine O-methyltransferase Ste14
MSDLEGNRMRGHGRLAAATAAGAGLYAAIALGYVNHAAHQGSWGMRTMFAAFGLYAAAGAMRLAGRRRDVASEAGRGSSALIVICSLLPFAARPAGSVVWEGGPWIAAAGAFLGLLAVSALGDCFAVAPALRGVVSNGPYAAVRHPMACAFLAIAGGYLSIFASPWNAAVLGLSGAVAVAAALLEERLLMKDGRYRDYAARVRWRFVPGLV